MEPRLPILVLAPTARELEPLRRLIVGGRLLEAPSVTNVQASAARPGEGLEQRAGGRIKLVVSGVGKANAALAAGFHLARERYRALLNIGCAGAFPHTGLSPGDVVIADSEIFADEGALSPSGFLNLADLGLANADGPRGAAVRGNLVPIRPACRLLPRHLSELSTELGCRVVAGPLCTVSTCSGTNARGNEMFERWHALAESMEGAAAALAADRLGLPFLEVRGISNLAGDRDHDHWRIPDAVERAALVAARLLAGASAWPDPPAGDLELS